MYKLRFIIIILCVFGISINLLDAQGIDYSTINKSNEQPVNDLKQCLHNKIKYPFFMQVYKLEGRVFVLLSINEKGKVEGIKVEADYFGKIYDLDKFTNPNRIERLRKKLEDRLIPLFTECAQNITFSIPANEKIIKIPVSFGTYDDLNDYGISDDYDDYDYKDDYDYNYYDYE